MSRFYAELKHKLIEAKSPDYKMIMENDDFLSSCASAALTLVKDTGFNMIGFVDMPAKKYFLITKLSSTGQMLEMPISTDLLDLFKKANDADIPKHRMKKALKRDDCTKFMLEMERFFYSQC